MKHHNKLTEVERDRIAVMKASGKGVREIARTLKRSPSTVSDELKRNGDKGAYVAIQAQSDYERRKSKAGIRQPLKNKDVYKYVIGKLQEGWSPELIAGRLKRNHPKDPRWWISYETIYQYIYDPKNIDEGWWEYLPRKQKKRKKKNGRTVHRSRIPDRVSIHLRPGEVNQRAVFGHYEGDTVEGVRSVGDGIHTEVERVSRITFAVKVAKITSEEAIRAQQEIFEELPPVARGSTTLDNGRENHLHMKLRNLNMKTYFADPYSSWQRGTNEFHNGLIRRYLPKGTDFSTITQEDLDDIVWEINNRPRKVLEYATPLEVFNQCLSKCSD